MRISLVVWTCELENLNGLVWSLIVVQHGAGFDFDFADCVVGIFGVKVGESDLLQ